MRGILRSALGQFVIAGLLCFGISCSESEIDPTARRPLPLIRPDGDLIDVAVPAKDSFVVLSDTGKIYVSRDAGATFRSARVPAASSSLQSLSMASAEAGWAVGPGVILRTDDGGVTWRRLRGPRRAAELGLREIAAIDDQRAVAIGAGGLRIRTGDGGAIWREIPDAHRESGEAPTEWTALACLAEGSGRCWVAGRELEYSQDSGATWEILERADPLAPMVVDFRFGQADVTEASRSRILEAYEGRPATTELDWQIDARVSAGEVERIAQDADPHALFELIEARGEEIRLLLEGFGVEADRIERVAAPPWGYEEVLDDDPNLLERYWASRLAASPVAQIRTREPMRLSGLAVDRAGKGVGVGEGGRGIETRDAASRWRPFGVPGADDLQAVARSGDRLIVLDGDGGLWSQSDSGSVWVSGFSAADSAPVDALRAIGFDPTGDSGYIVGARGRMLVTHDAGASWQVLGPLVHVQEQVTHRATNPGTGSDSRTPRPDADSSRSASLPINP